MALKKIIMRKIKVLLALFIISFKWTISKLYEKYRRGSVIDNLNPKFNCN